MRLFSFAKPSGRVRRRVAPLLKKLLHPQTENALGKRRRSIAVHPHRLLLAILTTVVLSILLCAHLWPDRVTLRLGDVSDHPIVAQRTVRYEDTSATDLLRADAAHSVERRYEQIGDATAQAQDAVLNTFAAIEEAVFVRPQEFPQKGKTTVTAAADDTRTVRLAQLQIRRRAGIVLEAPAIRTLLRQDAGGRRAAAMRVTSLVEKGMMQAIRDDGDVLARARKDIRRAAQSENGDAALKNAVAAIASAVMRPNLRYDSIRTERERSGAQDKIVPQFRQLTAGTTILHEGERVAQQHLDAFAALGLQNAAPDARMIAVISLIVVLLVILVAAYLWHFHRTIYKDTSSLFLLSLLSVFSVVGLKVGTLMLGLPFPGVHFGYLGMMCVASAGMAIALLVSPSVATLIVALLSVVSGLIINSELRFTMITLGSSLAGIIAVATLRNRNDLVRAMLLLCGANAVLNVLVGMMEGDTGREILSAALWGFVSGLFALMLFWVGVAILERAFGIATHLRLLDLSDPATPILQEFRLRVPGTYAHSLMVANLAHSAAEAIGADALLCRVAAYYHDLGKMHRPQFFIENQANVENIHDRLSPSMSALILSSHLKDSVAIAESVGLPKKVREIIGQHHGTSLMRFFYHRAAEGFRTGDVPRSLEEQFRYPGPKPQSREAAILMLADTVEAASRTLDKPTPMRIREFVAYLIEEKRADNQLDECDLTMRDVKTVENTFAHILTGTLHARIEYPKSSIATGENAANRRGRNSSNGMPIVPGLSASALAESLGEPLSPSENTVASEGINDIDDVLVSGTVLGMSPHSGFASPPGPVVSNLESALYGDNRSHDARIRDARLGSRVRRLHPKTARRNRSG